MNVTNTGEVTLKGVTIDIPSIFMPTLACVIGSQPYLASSNVSLAPGAVLTCESSCQTLKKATTQRQWPLSHPPLTCAWSETSLLFQRGGLRCHLTSTALNAAVCQPKQVSTGKQLQADRPSRQRKHVFAESLLGCCLAR